MSEGAFLAGSIFSKLLLDKTQFETAALSAAATIEATGKKIESGSQRLAAMGTKLEGIGKKLSFVSLPILGIGAAATKMAMDAVESENLFEVSMGKMAGEARAWSEDMGKALGLNQYELRKNVATFNVMLDSMGLGTEKAYGMAKGLTQLSYDMASFYNLKPEEAFQKLQSGISGEIEPLKRLGIVVNENTTQQWALTNGLIKQGQEMTESQKITARYNVILAATEKAQGDLANTIDSPTNRLRLLKSRIQETGIQFGQLLIPALTSVVSAFQKFANWLANMDEQTKKTIVGVLGLVAAAGPVLFIFGKLIGVGASLYTGVGKLIGNLSGLVLKFGSAGGAAGAFMATLSTAAVGALIFELGKLVVTLIQTKQAIDYAADAEERDTKRTIDYSNKLYELVKAGKMTADQFYAMEDRYKGNAAAMGLAIKQGKEGKDLQVALADVGAKHSIVLEAQAKVYGAVTDAAAETKVKVQTLAEFMAGEGIMTITQKNAKIKELEDRLGQLTILYGYGRISGEDYAEAVKKMTGEIDKLKGKIVLTVPEARDMNDVLKNMPGFFKEGTAWSDRFNDVIATIGGKTIPMMREEARNYLGLQKLVNEAFKAGALNGDEYRRLMDDLQSKIRGTGETNKETVDKVRSGWEGLFVDIAKGWGNLIKDSLQNDWGLRGFLRGMWGQIKDTFYTFVGDMISRWAVDFMENIFKKKTAEAAASAASSITTTAGGAIAGLGTTISTVATAIGSVITTVAAALSTAVVSLAEGISLALVTIATAIASAATVLAAAAPALLTVGAIALGLFAGFKLIEKLLGSGGGADPNTYWLKLISNNMKETRDWIGELWQFQLSEQWTVLQRLRDVADAALEDGRTANGILAQIADNTARTIDAIRNISGAASGAVSTQTELKILHGTPDHPEYVLPERDLAAAANRAAAAGASAGPRDLAIKFETKGQPIRMGDAIRGIVVQLVPELTKKGVLLIHPDAVRTY